MSCIRSSPGYFEALRADWKIAFYSMSRAAKVEVGISYPANYEYTTLALTTPSIPTIVISNDVNGINGNHTHS